MGFVIVSLAYAAALAVDPPTQIAPSEGGLGDQMEISVPNADFRIAAKTVVQIEISEVLSSKTNNVGDTFALKLTEPLSIHDRVVLPAGLVGRGEVTHAAKRGWGGKAGELIVNARYLECGDLRIPLGYFHYGIAGKNNVGGALATAQVIPLGQFMVSGHEASIPAGTRGTARVKTEVIIPAAAINQCKPQAE